MGLPVENRRRHGDPSPLLPPSPPCRAPVRDDLWVTSQDLADLWRGELQRLQVLHGGPEVVPQVAAGSMGDGDRRPSSAGGIARVWWKEGERRVHHANGGLWGFTGSEWQRLTRCR